MRETCLMCVSEHLASAIILLIEASLGYPMHIWFAVAHLNEAETEALELYPDFAESIRKVRCSLMGQPDCGSFKKDSVRGLLVMARALAQAHNGYSEEERVKKILAGENLSQND